MFLNWSSLEVFSIFYPNPQAGLARINRHTDRQGMVPDMKITLTTAGVFRQVWHQNKAAANQDTDLADLKVA